MNNSFFVVALVTLPSITLACPDLSGAYRGSGSTREILTLVQTKCDSITMTTIIPGNKSIGFKEWKHIQKIKIGEVYSTNTVEGKNYWDKDKYVTDTDMSKSHQGKLKIEMYKSGGALFRTTSGVSESGKVSVTTESLKTI